MLRSGSLRIYRVSRVLTSEKATRFPYRRLVDRLKGNLASFACKLRTDLVPKPVELFFDQSNIRSGQRHIGPGPTVVVDIHNGVESFRGDHINDIRHTLQPCGIHIPSRRLGREMI